MACHSLYYSGASSRSRPQRGAFLIYNVCGEVTLKHTVPHNDFPPSLAKPGLLWVFVPAVRRYSRARSGTGARGMWGSKGDGLPFLEMQGAFREPWAGVKKPSVFPLHVSPTMITLEVAVERPQTSITCFSLPKQHCKKRSKERANGRCETAFYLLIFKERIQDKDSIVFFWLCESCKRRSRQSPISCE